MKFPLFCLLAIALVTAAACGRPSEPVISEEQKAVNDALARYERDGDKERLCQGLVEALPAGDFPIAHRAAVQYDCGFVLEERDARRQRGSLYEEGDLPDAAPN